MGATPSSDIASASGSLHSYAQPNAAAEMCVCPDTRPETTILLNLSQGTFSGGCVFSDQGSVPN